MTKLTDKEAEMVERYMKQQVDLTKWLIGIVAMFLMAIVGGMGTMYKQNSAEHSTLLENVKWTHLINDFVIEPNKVRSIKNLKHLNKLDSVIIIHEFRITSLEK